MNSKGFAHCIMTVYPRVKTSRAKILAKLSLTISTSIMHLVTVVTDNAIAVNPVKLLLWINGQDKMGNWNFKSNCSAIYLLGIQCETFAGNSKLTQKHFTTTSIRLPAVVGVSWQCLIIAG